MAVGWTSNAYNLNRLSNINNYETGLSGTFGFDYKLKKTKKINLVYQLHKWSMKRKTKKWLL